VPSARRGWLRVARFVGIKGVKSFVAAPPLSVWLVLVAARGASSGPKGLVRGVRVTLSSTMEPKVTRVSGRATVRA